MYESILDSRDVKFIRHFNTPQSTYPNITQMAQLKKIQHVWKTGDRYYKLAAQYYPAPEYWWVIAQFNKKPTESDVSPGDLIYIPLPLETVLGFYLR